MIKKYFIYWFSIIFIFPANGQLKKIGFSEITNYKRTDYKGETQNWDTDQDKNGNIYFANNGGLLEFDGAYWTKYQISNSEAVRSLKISEDGKIYVGGFNEFGYFEKDNFGKLIYKSISKTIQTKEKKQFEFIWRIHIIKGKVYFQSFSKIFVFENNKLKIIKAPKQFQFSFKIDNTLYIQDVLNGILKLENDILKPQAGTTKFNGTEIWSILKLSDSKILITTIDKGLFVYENNKISSWENEANNFVKKNSCLGGKKINKGYFVLNSVLDGAILIDEKGFIIQHINQKKGLQNNTVLNSFVDLKNNIWFGLDNGITHLNSNSPFSFFGFSYDISTVYASVIFENNLYVATNRGLFYHSWELPFKEANFKMVKGTTGQAWNIQVINNQLICSHNRGLFFIKNKTIFEVLSNNGYWGLKPIPENENLFIGSNYNGFSLFDNKNSNLNFQTQIEGFNQSVKDFEIENNNIWFKNGKVLTKIIIGEDYKKIEKIETFSNLTKKFNGIGTVKRLNNKVYFEIENHFFNHKNSNFIEDNSITNNFKKLPKISFIEQDNLGNIWYGFGASLGVLAKNKNNSYTKITAPFNKLKGNLVSNYFSVNAINSENIFIGLTEGLAHFDLNHKNQINNKPIVFIRSMAFGNQIYWSQNKFKDFEIPYEFNSIKITFSSPTYSNSNNLEYSYQLEGFDKSWSSWSSETFKEYTNLREGNYILKVKVRKSFDLISETVNTKFSIKPPWYRHYLAYFIYFIGLILIVYLIRMRTKMKIRKNKYYETIEQRKIYLEKETKILEQRLELEKEVERLNNEKLQTKILSKDKELVINSLQVVKKNKILNGIIDKIKDIDKKSLDKETKLQFNKLNKSITKEVNSENNWKDFEKHIKNVHFDFLKRLKEKHNTITPRESDLATYLLLNMSSKEIAEIMGITSAGVELSRYRLRKKMGLINKENLISYLMTI